MTAILILLLAAPGNLVLMGGRDFAGIGPDAEWCERTRAAIAHEGIAMTCRDGDLEQADEWVTFTPTP